MKQQLFIFGGASTALEIAEVAQRYFSDRFEVLLVVPDGEQASHEATIEESSIAKRRTGDAGYIVSMWNQKVRAACRERAEALGLQATSIIHPDAFISRTAEIGAGVYIAAHASISTNAKVHDHVVINFNTTVGHDSVIGTDTFLNPGARISGHAVIGERVLIGANSLVFQGKTVGDECLVDALTYVDRDLDRRSICSSKRVVVHKRIF